MVRRGRPQVLGIETSPDHIEHEGHLTRVCVCPVGIEPDVVRARSLAAPTLGAIRRLEGQLQGRALFLGVDTLDPTKGPRGPRPLLTVAATPPARIVRRALAATPMPTAATAGLVHKLLAFEELFAAHPELADELVFVQVVLGAGGPATDDAANETPQGAVVAKPFNQRTDSARSGARQLRLDHEAAFQSKALRSRAVFSTLERQLHAMVSRINSQYATLDFEGPVQYRRRARNSNSGRRPRFFTRERTNLPAGTSARTRERRRQRRRSPRCLASRTCW